MENGDWQKINRVVADALALDRGSRKQFIEGTDLAPAERAEVLTLLSVESESDSLMDVPAIAFSKDFFAAEAADPVIGRQIGSFEIVSELGHGGMGAVYLASRKVGRSEQHVALKLLKREMNTSVLRERFAREREILASLDHQNISRLVDFGATEEHIPYFAMEYVDGLPVDTFCRVKDYGLRDRLLLFKEICSAVAFAHRNLIVHRDLKPSNILVLDDGTPKLLDFGISKILSPASGDGDLSSTVTRLGAMTPSYASPEQLRGESVTTSTDVYSLGVILYELLSGHRPFETREMGLNDIMRAILDDDPLPPSSMAGSASNATEPGRGDITTHPGDGAAAMSPSMVRAGSIKGDLDKIVLKALRKEPENRYLSVDSFADDIERYLEGRPVLARRSTFSYRAAKFIRRNKVSVLAAAVVILAIAAGVAATLWQVGVARAERARAEARFNDVRDLANSFLFEITPQIERLPGSTPARVTLVKRALEYLNHLSQDAAQNVELQREIARAYDKVADVQGNPNAPNIGDVKGALDSYQKALDLRMAVKNSGTSDAALDSAIADDYQMLGTLNSFGGEYSKATTLLDRSLEIRNAVLETDPANFEWRKKLASATKARGLIPFFDGDNKTALIYYQRSQDIYEKLLAERPDDDDIASEYYYLFVNIGEALAWEDQSEAAAASIEKGIEPLIAIAARHPNDERAQRTLDLAYSKHGEVLEDLEQYLKAIAAFSKALAGSQQRSAADPTNFQALRDMALAYKKLGQTQGVAGKGAESLDSISHAIDAFRRLSEGDPNNSEALYDVANTTFSLGETMFELKRFAEARASYEKSRDLFKQVLALNPDSSYARRMSSLNYQSLAKTLAATNGDQAAIAANYQLALDGLTALQSEGKLGAFDLPLIEELKKSVASFDSK